MNLSPKDWIFIGTFIFGMGVAYAQLENKADKTEIEVVKEKVENNEKKLEKIDKKIDKIYEHLIKR